MLGLMEGNNSRVASIFIMIAGVICVSTGPVFVRLAEAHPLVKGAYRLGISSLVIAPATFAMYRRELRSLARRDLLIGMLSGLFLSAHFAAWIASLDYTTVASSVVLVNTVPIWVPLLEAAAGRWRRSRAMVLGIALSVTGAAIVGWGDIGLSEDAIIGDALAAAGAIAAAAYIICGSALRVRLSLLPYITICYGTAAAALWTAALVMGLETAGFTARTWGAFLGMALIAQIAGHGSYNWALGRLSAGMVSILLLGEPIGSSVIAYFLLGEMPAPQKLAGFAMILSAIAISARSGG